MELSKVTLRHWSVGASFMILFSYSFRSMYPSLIAFSVQRTGEHLICFFSKKLLAAAYTCMHTSIYRDYTYEHIQYMYIFSTRRSMTSCSSAHVIWNMYILLCVRILILLMLFSFSAMNPLQQFILHANNTPHKILWIFSFANFFHDCRYCCFCCIICLFLST